jgi:hypothetical protein
MIKRLLLPHRPRPSKCPVQAMRGRRFNPLQNLNQAVKIPMQITKWCQQKMHMVRHDHGRMNRRLRSLVMQTVPQHDVPDRFRQRIEAAAKRDKHRPIILLIVRQPPSILVLRLQQCLSHRSVQSECVERAPPPAAFAFSHCAPKRPNRSVTKAQSKCDNFGNSELPRRTLGASLPAGEGARATRVWESRSLPA